MNINNKKKVISVIAIVLTIIIGSILINISLDINESKNNQIPLIAYEFHCADNISTGREYIINYNLTILDRDELESIYTIYLLLPRNYANDIVKKIKFINDTSGSISFPTYSFEAGTYKIQIWLANWTNSLHIYPPDETAKFEIIYNESSPPFKKIKQFYVVDSVIMNNDNVVVTSKRNERHAYAFGSDNFSIEDIYHFFINNTNKIIRYETYWSNELHKPLFELEKIGGTITGFLIGAEKKTKDIYSYKRVYSSYGNEVDYSKKFNGQYPYMYDNVKVNKIGEKEIGTYLYFQDISQIYVDSDTLGESYSFKQVYVSANYYVGKNVTVWRYSGIIFCMEEMI